MNKLWENKIELMDFKKLEELHKILMSWEIKWKIFRERSKEFIKIYENIPNWIEYFKKFYEKLNKEYKIKQKKLNEAFIQYQRINQRINQILNSTKNNQPVNNINYKWNK